MDEVTAEAQRVLDPVPLSARAARSLVREVLAAGGRDDWSDAATLATSELVTNAILHAHTPVEVRATLTAHALRVEVRDFSPVMADAHEWGAEATTGRGLALVGAVAVEHGVERLGAAGKIVWFCLSEGDAPALSSDELLERWADEVAAPPATVDVTLVGFPVTLWLAAREHHDAILRDLALYLLGEERETPVTEEKRTQTDRARHTIAAALDRALSASSTPPVLLDLSVPVPTELTNAFAVMQDVLDEAERLAARGVLLVRPALPEIVALRDWACEQVIGQLRSTPPTPWPGAARQEFTSRSASTDLPAWDVTSVAEASEAVIAVDDANRILAVSRRLADRLGWESRQLVGRRLVTIIPTRLRDTHVAGFTDHLATGRRRIIGRTVVVPVLHHAGHELQGTLTIETHDAHGRTVFVGHLDVS